MPRVVHFEILADDPERSGPQGYWLLTTGPEGEPGINGAIMNRNDPKSTIYTIVDVPSVDEYVQKVEAAGGKIVLPKMTVPGVGYVAYFADSEGNVMGMVQNDPNVK